MVLNKKEKSLMKVIYEFANNKKGQCMISPIALLQSIPYKLEFRECDLEKTLNDLSLEGYFDYETATKKDDIVYIIKLKEKGLAYQRDITTHKKTIIRRVITTVAIALLGVLIKQIINLFI